jgi:biopolymer transport protein ExbD
MRLTKKKRRFGTEINITPLIDIVFLLIIFSMVVSQFSKLQAENVKLPEARKGDEPKPTRAGRVVINLLPSGGIVVAGARQGLASLGALLDGQVRLSGADGLSVVVRSDRRTPWKFVRPVLELCAARRIGRVKVAVVEPEAPSGRK